MPSALTQAIGRPDLTFKLHLIELPVYLLTAWFLIVRRGIEGAAIAWLARTALDLLLCSSPRRAGSSRRARRG